jgi:predicted XRE-type DNA-binding protein
MTDENKFSFPNEEEFLRVVENSENKNSERRTNFGLSSNATPADKLKFDFCKSIQKQLHKNNLSEKQLAKKLGVSRSRIERIIFCHIDEFSLEELVNYLDRLSVHLEMKVESKYDSHQSAGIQL